MKRLLCTGSILLFITSLSWVGAYFEEQYFCTIEGNTIEVSLTSGSAICFSYIAQVTQNLITIKADIDQANAYLDQGRDKTYWTQVRDELNKSRDNLMNLRTQMIAAIDDYEIEFFLQVKSLVAGYLMPKRQEVVDKIATADSLLLSLKKAGDSETYSFVVKQAERLQQQLILYDRIRFSGSFMELIPPLKLYIQGGGFELDSIEDKPTPSNIT